MMIFYKLKAVLIFWRHFGFSQTLLYLFKKMTGARLISILCPSLGGDVWIRSGTSDFAVLVQMREEMGDLNLGDSPDLIIDGGCNIGLSVRYFHERFPNARIKGFEPDRGNYEIAARNNQHIPGIELFAQALWSRGCELRLKNPGALPWAYEFEKAEETVGGGIPAISLNEILQSEKEDLKILVKLDVEGAEKTLLTEEIQWISRVKWILVEIHGAIEDVIDLSVLPLGFTKGKVGEKVLYRRSRR